MASSINYQAGGNILPATFVMANYPIDDQVVQANGTQPILGISQMGVRDFPGGTGQTTYCAGSGQLIGVFADEEHDEPLLQVSAPVTGGQMLISDANGYGIPWVPSSTSTQYVGAEARQSSLGATFPQYIRVRPRFFAGRAS